MTTILVVDDSPQDRQSAVGLLSSLENVQIETACGGLEALDLLEQLRSAIVVTDLHMPDMDGIELLKCVRNDFRESPVVVMTAHGSEEIAAVALNEGASGYVPKRFLETQLVSLIRQFMDDVRHNSEGNEITMIRRGGAAAM